MTCAKILYEGNNQIALHLVFLWFDPQMYCDFFYKSWIDKRTKTESKYSAF